MGVKGLWTILQPYSERRPLFELQNKVVAIDLAGWVCEAMCVMNYEVQPRFYLRNLFFRTSYLLLSGVTPVFVLEGTAPPLKFGVICKRLESGPLMGSRPRRIARHNGVDGQTNNPKKAAQGRTSFNRILKQCEEMLSYLGVTCVQGPGEAEAFCAYLNKAGMVDGVISQDSDCFAYGARRVYRNFSVASQGKTAAQGGSVDVYDMDKIEQAMDFGQRKMVAMALLCGCDYCPDGVSGVGREAAFKFFSLFAENEVLERMRAWRTTPDAKFDARRHDRVLCTSCGHAGAEHWRTGCTQCGTEKNCADTEWEAERLFVNNKAIKSEMQIRRKALVDPDFPSEAIIDEFLVMPTQLPPLDLRWKQPNVVRFVRLMHDSVQWNEAYGLAKILPMLTRWQLFHLGNDDTDDDATDSPSSSSSRTEKLANMRGAVQPECIKKKRTPKGIASYEIVWKDATGYFDGLVTGMQVQNYLAEHKIHDTQTPWSTIEPVDLVERAYPELIEQFLAQIQAKKKPVSRRIASVANMDVAQASLPPRKRRARLPKPAAIQAAPALDAIPAPSSSTNPARANSQTAARTPVLIDRFLQRMQARYVKKSQRKAAFAIGAVPKSPARPAVELRRRSFLSPRIQTSAQPMNLSQFSFVADDSMKWTEEADLSNLIREMMHEPPTTMSFCGRRLRFEAVLDTSDVCFMAIDPEEAENGVAELEVKPVAASTSAVTVSSPEPSTSRMPNKETFSLAAAKHDTSPKTPKALHGRPVSKFDHNTRYDLNTESIRKKRGSEDNPKEEIDPWKPMRLYEHIPFERKAEIRTDVDVNAEPVAPSTLTVADESIDEFDRLVLAGNKNTGAFVELPKPKCSFIGSWTHINSSDAAPSTPSSDDPNSSFPTLQITGDGNAFLCSICSRIDPYNLHQCRVPVLYDGNTALKPPASTPSGEHVQEALVNAAAAPQRATYAWGSVQIGPQRFQLTPGKRFKEFVDYWRHFYDHEHDRVQPWHRLWQPPDMAVHEHLEELWTKRLAAAATSTPHDRRSRHKRRSNGTMASSDGAGASCSATVVDGGSPHSISHFFQVADDADLDWHPDDAVDNGATGKVHDDFEACVDLWHEPDQFKPSDADVVGSLYDAAASDGTQHRSAAAAAAMEERLESVAQMRCIYGELKRDNCDFEVRLLARGKVNLKGKLMDERPHRVRGRVKGPHAIDGVLMVGAMTPSVLAAERPEVSFRVLPTVSKRPMANSGELQQQVVACAGGSKENEAGQSNVERGPCNGVAASAATVTVLDGNNDSFELNGSYVPVSKKLRNKMDSV